MLLQSHYQAFRCIGDLIFGHSQNLNILASKFLGDEPQVEPALNSILRIILRTISMKEFIAADYVFKSFCEVFILKLLSTIWFFYWAKIYILPPILMSKWTRYIWLEQQNADGQSMLASTLIPQPLSMTHAPFEEDVNMTFGRYTFFTFHAKFSFWGL